MSNSRSKKVSLIVLCVLLFIIVGIGFFIYFRDILFTRNIFTPEEKKTYINIPEDNLMLEDVLSILKEKVVICNIKSLEKTIQWLNYETIRSGHYEITNGMNNKDLVRMLQRGLQTPVKVTFNNIRTKEQLAGNLAKQLMPDSLSILTLLNDSSYISLYDFNTENVLTMFIPNTYEFFWNIQEEKIFERMYREYKKFWNDNRIEKALEIGFSPIEISILASIVEEETNLYSEYPVVAGLYINRLQKGMLLQADPTVKYAVGDFMLRRVLNAHLQIDSPYNTYKYKGLPPGPIRIPSVKAIDAVLNYQKHNYLYMVAKETLNGEHNFAVTLSEHNKNADKYRRALNNLGIYR